MAKAMESYIKDYMKKFLNDNEILLIFDDNAWFHDHVDRNPFKDGILHMIMMEGDKKKNKRRTAWDEARFDEKVRIKNDILQKFNTFVSKPTSLIKQVEMKDKFDELNGKSKKDISKLEENKLYLLVTKKGNIKYYGLIEEVGEIVKHYDYHDMPPSSQTLPVSIGFSIYPAGGRGYSYDIGRNNISKKDELWPDEEEDGEKLYVYEIPNLVKGIVSLTQEAKKIVAKEKVAVVKVAVVKDLSGGRSYRINYSQ